jgi:DNA replication protein DnaC
MTTTDPLAQWAGAVARHVPELDEERADALIAEADRIALEEIQVRQMANRVAAYQARRPALYRDACYSGLAPEQNPRGLVSTWWAKGPRSLTLVGPTRTGKTTAAYAITNDAHVSGAWVVAGTAADLSAELKPDGEPLAFDYAVSCDLLLLDDLGRERVTDWWLEQLQRIVDARRTNERRLIVTTNTLPDPQAAYDELAARYGAPVAERLIDDGGIVVLDGPAHRRVVSEW